MSRAPEAGFTLVEVVASISVFAIAFLASSSAVSTFMLRQDDCFQRTVAASAAMLLVDSHHDRLAPTGLTPTGTATGSSLFEGDGTFLTKVSTSHPTWYTDLTFRGQPKGFVKSGDQCLVFNPSGLVPDPTRATAGTNMLGGINVAEYKQLVITVSVASFLNTGSSTDAAVAGRVSSPNGTVWKRISFWSGHVPTVLTASTKTTVQFLGSYLYADGIQ